MAKLVSTVASLEAQVAAVTQVNEKLAQTEKGLINRIIQLEKDNAELTQELDKAKSFASRA